MRSRSSAGSPSPVGDNGTGRRPPRPKRLPPDSESYSLIAPSPHFEPAQRSRFPAIASADRPDRSTRAGFPLVWTARAVPHTRRRVCPCSIRTSVLKPGVFSGAPEQTASLVAGDLLANLVSLATRPLTSSLRLRTSRFPFGFSSGVRLSAKASAKSSLPIRDPRLSLGPRVLGPEEICIFKPTSPSSPIDPEHLARKTWKLLFFLNFSPFECIREGRGVKRSEVLK